LASRQRTENLAFIKHVENGMGALGERSTAGNHIIIFIIVSG
jgi:hypothetical protein